jgi:hypothetical protein
VESASEREEIFQEYVAAMLEAVQANFRQLLHETKSFTTATSGPAFETALKLLHSDKRWAALDETPEIRQKLIEEYGGMATTTTTTTTAAAGSTNGTEAATATTAVAVAAATTTTQER